MSKERISALEDLAIRAMNETKAIRARAEIAAEQHNGVWPAEDREAFQRATDQFTKYHSEKIELEKQAGLSEAFDNIAKGYQEPRETFQHKAPNANGNGDGPSEVQTNQKAAHRDAYRRYLRHGEPGLSREEYSRYVVQIGTAEQFALVSNVDNLGGFLVPDDETNELLKDTAGFAVIRNLARVRQTVRQVRSFLTIAGGTDPYPSGVSGAWRQEGDIQGGNAIPTQNQPTFGLERVPTHIWRPDVIELTIDLIEDASIDIESEVRMLLAETKALDEDSAFINGSGVGQPQGLLNAQIPTIDSGSDNNWVFSSPNGGIVQLYTGLPAQYRNRASWLMNSLTYGLLLSLSTNQNQMLFAPNTLPNTMYGRPMYFSEFMPNGNVDMNKSIVFGDFSYYGIVDRRDLRVQRLVERYAPNIGLLPTARTGGQVLRTAPFRIGVTHSVL